MASQRSADQLRSLLERRISRLIAPILRDEPTAPHSYPADTVQDAIVEVVSRLHHRGWSAYLVGGTLRDLVVEADGERSFRPRDVDIVVGGATRDALQEVLRDHLVLERLTRFGGLHLIKTLSSGSRILFDVWTLADTWGFQSQQILPRIEDFPGTTFLNIDSCAVEIQATQGTAGAVYEKGFFAGIARGALDVNYAPNPYPYVCAARALILAARLDFTLSRALAKFVLDQNAAGGLQAFVEAQLSHYGTVRSDAAELGRWLQDIERQFDGAEDDLRLDVAPARRLELCGDETGF
jgi:hypothetical protein